MTVTTNNNTSVGTGDGVTATFPFTFALQQATDMEVFVATVLQTYGSAYTVSPSGGSYPCVGGNVVFAGGHIPANLAAILMVREVDLLQSIALPVDGYVSELTLTNVFDKLCMQIQQNTNFVNNNTLSLPVTIPPGTVSVVLPVPTANGIFAWNAAANAINYIQGPFISPPLTTTINKLVIWNATDGSLVADGPVFGTMGQLLLSQGNGAAPLFGAAPGAAGTVLTSNGVNTNPTYQTSAGSINGPVTSTDWSLALWNGTTGKILRDGPALGVAGQSLISNGAAAAPSFQNNPVSGLTWNMQFANASDSGASNGTFIIAGTTTPLDLVSVPPASGTLFRLQCTNNTNPTTALQLPAPGSSPNGLTYRFALTQDTHAKNVVLDANATSGKIMFNGALTDTVTLTLATSPIELVLSFTDGYWILNKLY